MKNEDANYEQVLDPTEEVGPELCECSPADAQLPPNDGGQQHEQVSFLDELHEAYEPDPIVVARHPDDGLPFVPDERDGELAIAPSLSYESFICAEDSRQYVEVFDDEMIFSGFNFFPNPSLPSQKQVTGIPKTFGAMPNDKRLAFLTSIALRSKYDDDGKEVSRRVFESGIVKKIFGLDLVESCGKYIPVKQIRPKCEYYKRQVFNNDEVTDPTAPGHRIVFRNCAIRTSVGGAAMSLRDQAVYACEWRSPPDPSSVKRHLDIFDEQRFNSSEKSELIPLFGEKNRGGQ